MTNYSLKLYNKNFKQDQSLDLNAFRNEFRPEIIKALEAYSIKEKVSDVDFDKMLNNETSEVLDFLTKFIWYFNNYVESNWFLRGVVAYDKNLYGTKVYDYEKKSIALIIKVWKNTFSGSNGKEYIDFATCVDYNGKKYETALSNLSVIEDMEQEELNKLGLN